MSQSAKYHLRRHLDRWRALRAAAGGIWTGEARLLHSCNCTRFVLYSQWFTCWLDRWGEGVAGCSRCVDVAVP